MSQPLDGNMCRRLLKNHTALMAEQCAVSEKLLCNFYYLYVALASKLPLCPKKIQGNFLIIVLL